MFTEETITYIIYTHATFGGIALAAGLGAILAKKGALIHRRSGVVFYYSMLVSAVLALLISVLPKHESPFLFTIGIFSLYFVLSGYRALGFNKKVLDLRWDKFISWTMLITGLVMILYPIILYGKPSIVLGIFGAVGIIFSVRDLSLFKDPKRLRRDRLGMHVGKIMGGYISAVTAFVVVNRIIPGVYAWFVPGLVGGFYIAYWLRKLDPKKEKTAK